MAQITSVVSEPLQAKIRSLLPSQSGFTEDLQAQNVIVPIIDLTETASGSVLREDLQKSLAFGSQTSFNVSNTTTTIADVAGFYRVIGSTMVRVVNSGSAPKVELIISDGSTDKTVWGTIADVTTIEGLIGLNIDFVFYLNSGDSFKVFSNNANCQCIGSVRQIADSSGNLVNPSGFTSE